MKKFLSLILALALLITLAGPSQSVSAATIKISKSKATMEMDSTLKLSVTGTKSKVTWKSSASSVASVNGSGTIAAKKEGSATITATVSGVKYTCAVTVVNSNKVTAATEKIYNIGDKWKVDGLWTLTFNAVTPTDDRNQFSDKKPDQVVILNYTYENLGYKGDIMDLFISSNAFKVIDGNGEVASTYPASVTVTPKETPIGAKCVGAQEAYGLNNESSVITVYVELYDNNYKKHSATFKLKVD